MNQRLHGKRALTSLRFAVAAVLLSAVPLIHTADAQPEGGPRSGVVTPAVSILRPGVASKQPLIEEFVFPKPYSLLYGLALDSKDRVWVTEMAANSLAVFDPATGELKEYRIPSTVGLPEVDWEYDPKNRTTPESAVNVYTVGSPGAVIVDRNDVVWFVTQLGNSIVRFDPGKEEFTEFMIPTPNAQPYDLAADSKGRIWFVEKNSGKLGFLDVEREKSIEISIGEGANIMGIAIDGDDNVWISEVNGNYIGRYNPETKTFKKFPITVPVSQPGMMRFAKNGVLWICNLHSQQLGVLMTEQGVYSVVDLPGFNAVPQALAPADDGKIWIVDSMTNNIGFFNSANLNWRIFSIPTPNSQPMNIAIDSSGDVWFTESGRNANRIARLKPSTVPPEQAAAPTAVERKTSTKAARADNESMKRASLYLASALIFVALVIGFLTIRRFRK